MTNGLPNKKSSPAKWVASFLSIFLFLLILCLLALPMFFSTSVGKKYLLKMIGNRTGFELEIQELSLSWFGTQEAKGVHAQKPQEQMDFTAEEVRSTSPLWKIVFMDDIGQAQITSALLKISKDFQPTVYQRKKTTFQAASFIPQPQLAAVKSRLAPAVRGNVIVHGGKVIFDTPGLEPITFDQIEASLDMASKEEISVTLSCTTSPQGQIAIKGSAANLSASFPSFIMQSTIQQLPVRGIDQLVSLFYPELNGLVYSFLGPTINLGCQLSASSGNFDLRLNAVSAQLNAYVATQSLNGMLSLKSPAELNYNFTPDFLQKIVKLYPFLGNLVLAQPALIQTTIEQFSCPVPSTALDLLCCSFQASLTGPSEISLLVGGNPVSLRSLTGQANSPSLEQHLIANLTAGLETQGQIGSIAIESDLSKLFDKTMQGTLSLNAKGFPVGLLGAFPSLKDVVGPTADVIATAELQPANQKVHLSWQSNFLKIPAADFSIGKSLSLVSPSAFTFSLNPQFFNTLLPQEQIQLVKADPLQGMLQNLVIPLDSIKNARIDATLQTGQMIFNGCVPLKIAKMQTLLSVNTLDQVGLQINGDPLKANLSFAYNLSTGMVTLTKPFFAQCTFDQPTFKTIMPTAPPLAKQALVQLSLEPFVFSPSNFDLNKLKLKGQISNPEMVLGSQGKQISLLNTNLPFQWDSTTNTAMVQISSQVQNPEGSQGTMQGQFNFANFTIDKGVNFSSASILGSLELQNLSSLLLDTFSGRTLSPIIGPVFSSKFNLQSTAPDKQSLGVKWTSPYLTIDSNLVADKSYLQLQGSNHQMSWVLTPESYKALDQMLVGKNNGLIPFEIKEPSSFAITLSKLSLPMSAKKNVGSLSDRLPDIDFDFGKLQLSAAVRNPKLVFFDRSSQETIQLLNLAMTLNKNGTNPLTFSLDSNVATQSSNVSNAKNGSISLGGNLAQTMTPQGAFDFSKLTGSFQFKAQQLPSRALDIFARAKGRTDFPFTAIFGNVINAAIRMDLDQFSGPVSCNINTPNTKADINGTIDKGTLALKEDAHIQIKITPEISRLVLKEVNPLNLSYLYSQAPITLEIPYKGFSFPIFPSNISRVTIPSATIELGKIVCRNEGNVNTTLGLLKSSQFDKTNELMLWFAPIDLHVQQGLVDIERTEILLANTYDVCTWGNVNLLDNYVDMVLGLTAQTLTKAFGLKNLPDNYVLTLPMRGKADNVQIDTKKATAKVALLFAWQQASSAGGPAGAILGGLVNKMATLPDSDIKVPPAKRPFPWEVGKGRTSADSNEKKKQFKLNEKPIKQILKLIK